ncbi:MAG: cytochrome c3 family protein [candidate division WOR-3 bacterium]
MKKVTAAAVALVALGAASAMAQVGNSNIINSKHNLNGIDAGSFGSNAQANNQICIYCHTPHNARMSVPIWNRNGKAASVYTLYSSVTMLNSKHATGFTPDSISLFCMSCHDGSVLGGTMIFNQSAATKFYGSVLPQGDTTISGNANLTTNLSTTHPINFVASKNLNDATNNPQKRNDGKPDLNFKDVDNMGVPGGKSFPLFVSEGQRGYLECSSCHSVHDDYYRPFLRDTMDKSQLCLGCHNK